MTGQTVIDAHATASAAAIATASGAATTAASGAAAVEATGAAAAAAVAGLARLPPLPSAFPPFEAFELKPCACKTRFSLHAPVWHQSWHQMH